MTETGGGNFVKNAVLFGRLLHTLGVGVNPTSMKTVIAALNHIQVTNRSDFYYTLRAILINKRADYELFHQAFVAFWRKPKQLSPGLTLPFGGDGFVRQNFPTSLPSTPDLSSNITEPAIEAEDHLLLNVTFSPNHALRKKDFAALSPEEEKTIKSYINDFTWDPPHKQTRRRKAGKPGRIDFRNTFSRSLRSGGEVLVFRHSALKHKPRPVILLADVSGSMELYSRILLHFIYALTAGLPAQAESFLFSTALTRITRQVNTRQIDRAVRDVSRQVPDWSGGTRIGQALRTFNKDWARRTASANAIVLLISDGLDRGDPDILIQEIARLQRGCHRLIWLNPLLGSPGYQPLARGMQAALPYIDEFRPVHNLASLEDLVQALAAQDAKAAPNTQRAARQQLHTVNF